MSEWIVDWDRACECLRSVALSQLIRDRFGKIGLRIFNFLLEESPPQVAGGKIAKPAQNCSSACGGRVLIGSSAIRYYATVPLAEAGRGANLQSLHDPDAGALYAITCLQRLSARAVQGSLTYVRLFEIRRFSAVFSFHSFRFRSDTL